MWHHNKVSVVFLSFNDADTIRQQIEDSFFTGFVDEVLVADSSSSDRTLSETSYTKARIVSSGNLYESFRTAVDRVSGDIIIFGDSKGNVPSSDMIKLLAYSADNDCVFSSRRRWMMNDLDRTQRSMMKKNLSFASKMSRHLATVIDDIFPPIFLLKKSLAEKRDFVFSGFIDLFPFDIMKSCLSSDSMYFQVPVEYHSLEMHPDEAVFTHNKKKKEVKKFVSLLKKDIRRRSEDKAKKSKLNGSDASVRTESQDPETIKRRISYLRKKLGAYEKPMLPEDKKKHIEKAIKKAASFTYNSSGPSRRRKSLKRQQAR